MKVFHNYFNTKEKKFENLSLALGFFDGVHTGHKKVIENCVKRAKENNTQSALLTFTNHPRCIINKQEPMYILDFQSRLKHIKQLNIDYCFVYDFNNYFLNLDYCDYLKNILINNFHPKFITTGFNHYFGKNRAGTCEKLKINEQRFGYIYNKIEPFKLDNEIVSSSLIREQLSTGDIEKANRMLDYNFFVEGTVIEGKRLGRTIDFPTANFSYKKNIIQIPYGVYAVIVNIDGQKYQGVLNFGLRPTVNEESKEPLCEVHILDFDKDIYAQDIKVEFIKKIRSEKKFESINDLKNQISCDINIALEILRK